MKTTRTIVGIISMVLFLIISLQSCVVGIGNALSNTGETSGTGGIVLAVFMLIGGIIGVVAKTSKGGSITSGCFYILGSILGYASVGSFTDLTVWATISLIFGLIFIITAIFQKKQKGEKK